MNNSQKQLSMVNIVPLVPAMKKLLSESASIAVNSLCKEYADKLKSGMRDEQLCEQFVVDLSKVADTDNAKKVLAEMNESVKAQETNIKLANQVYELDNSSCKFVAPMIESAVVDYITNKNSSTRDDVRVAVSLFEKDSHIKDILETLDYEAYAEKSGKKLICAMLKEQYKEKPEKTYTESEVNAIIESKMNETKKDEVVEHRHLESHIGLHSAIQNILKESGTNEKLKVFLGQYTNALNEGKAEELLYESFISGISNWNYLSAVDTEVSALKDRISKYKQDIDLKKILEAMKETSSYYIVPLIEDMVVEYANNKSMTKRSVLMQRLDSFDYDPFVRDMMSLISKDQSINNSVYLGESVELANKYVHTELTHSPIKAIKENECVFNVRGSYYARRGNSISKLNAKEVAALSESFKALCKLVNSSNVKINEDLNEISVYDENNLAKINESEILINGKKVTDKELEGIYENAKFTRSDALNFYVAVKVLNENFDDIAYIDFVKSIVSNDGTGRAVDVFKINENIFVNTSDSQLGSSTFYRNVNPIQCRNYINEHMEINVAPLFEDVLPEQEDVEKGIEEKKKEYQSYIDDLENKKEQLMKMKSEDMDTDDIDSAIEMINKEIDDTKADFKKYQDDSDKFMNGDENDADDSLKNEPASLGLVDKDDDKDSDKKDSDDDVHTNPDPDASNETPAELSTPMSGDTTTDVTDDSEDDINSLTFDMDDDSVDDEFKDIPDFDSDFDTPAPTVNGDNNTSFEVVRVSYNKNVKTGKANGKGEVFVIIPSVDANGDVHDETRKVTFYLDNERKVIINNEYMPLDMYNAILKAIEDCPETDTVDLESSNIQSLTDTTMDTPEFSVDVPEPKEVSSTDTLSDIKPVEKQSPAEVAAQDELPTYPISIGLYPEEIKPKTMTEFEKDLDDKLNIEHSESEAGGGEKILKIANKAQAHALRNYFKEWMNYNNAEFDNFFPELQKCFNNNPTGIDVQPTNEGVKIKNVNTCKYITENFSVVLPATKSICEALGVTYDKTDSVMSIIPESLNEAKAVYRRMKKYANTRKNVEQDVVDLLENYSKKIKGLNRNYKLTTAYNGILESRLNAYGIDTESDGGHMTANIKSSDYSKAKRILEEVYHQNAPTEVRDFFQFVCENVRITVKDESTGKTVEINTDDFNGKETASNIDDQANFDAAFGNTTFDPEKSLLFKDDEESADESDDKKDEKKSKNESNEATKDEESKKTEDADTKDDESSEKEHSEESGEEKGGSSDKESEEKPKKKFKFKATKKSANESVKTKKPSKKNKINESVETFGHGEPNVLDYVNLSNGMKGQIICKQGDGNFIVNAMGHTIIASPKEVKLAGAKFDTLETPFKYDESTLKGCYESYVGCGLYVNDIRVTPNDTKVQILEYMNSPDDKEIDIIVEGSKTKAMKKFIKLNESDVRTAMDLGNYRPGVIAATNESILINISDYTSYKSANESYAPVKIMNYDKDGNTHMSVMAGSMIKLNEANDEYHEAYESMYEEAINKLM